MEFSVINLQGIIVCIQSATSITSSCETAQLSFSLNRHAKYFLLYLWFIFILQCFRLLSHRFLWNSIQILFLHSPFCTVCKCLQIHSGIVRKYLYIDTEVNFILAVYYSIMELKVNNELIGQLSDYFLSLKEGKITDKKQSAIIPIDVWMIRSSSCGRILRKVYK